MILLVIFRERGDNKVYLRTLYDLVRLDDGQIYWRKLVGDNLKKNIYRIKSGEVSGVIELYIKRFCVPYYIPYSEDHLKLQPYVQTI